MAFDISYIIEAKDRFSGVVGKINRSAQALSRNIENTSSRIKHLQERAEGLGRTIGLRLSAPVAAFDALAVKQAANIETLTMQMKPYVGSLKDTHKFMKKLMGFTAKTPFRLLGNGTALASKYLMQFGIHGKKLIPTLRMVGDIAAQSGGDFSTIARVYGEAQSMGKIYMKHLYMLLQAGVNLQKPFDELTKGTKLYGKSLFDLAEKTPLPAALLKRLFEIMEKKGGDAHMAMAKLSRTFSGLLTTVRDNIDLALVPVGQLIIKTANLKGAMRGLIHVLGIVRDRFTTFVKAHPMLAKTLVIVSLLATALSPMLLIFGQIGFAIVGIGAAIDLLLSPITLIVLAIAALAAGSYYLYTRFKLVRMAVTGVATQIKYTYDNVMLLIHGFEYLFKKIEQFTHIKAIFSDIEKAFSGHFITTKVLGSAAAPAAHQMSLAGSPKASRVDLHLDVNDPSGIIKRLGGTVSQGDMSLNLGHNMAHIGGIL